MEMNVRKIKLFIPHAEIRIFVTDEMIKDYKKCQEEEKQLKNLDARTKITKKHNRCKDCSWRDCCLDSFFWICEMPQIKEKMTELIGRISDGSE